MTLQFALIINTPMPFLRMYLFIYYLFIYLFIYLFDSFGSLSLRRFVGRDVSTKLDW